LEKPALPRRKRLKRPCSAKLTAVEVAVALLLAAAPASSEDPTNKAARDLAIFLATKTPPHRCFVPIVKTTDGFSYWVPIIINRADIPVFLIDTGFSGSLVIPRGFLGDLRANGTLPPVTSTLADGSEITQDTIIVREIILPGCRAFANVRAIISPSGSDPLLGPGILSRFSSAGIDHKELGLVLVPEGLSP
jgi:predicted aspartyl protease